MPVYTKQQIAFIRAKVLDDAAERLRVEPRLTAAVVARKLAQMAEEIRSNRRNYNENH